MEWTVTIEVPDEYGEIQRAQVQIEKGFDQLTSGEIDLSIDDGKRIMSMLQEFVVKGVVARIWRGLAFGQEEAVEGWFVKLLSGFPSDAEQAQRRSSASFWEDEMQGQELGFL